MADNTDQKSKGNKLYEQIATPSERNKARAGLVIRRQLSDLLEFTRSRDHRDRLAALSFGDMLQEAVERLDFSARTAGTTDARAFSRPFDRERMGKLQEIEMFEKSSEALFDYAEKILKEKDKADIYATQEAIEDALEPGEFDDDYLFQPDDGYSEDDPNAGE